MPICLPGREQRFAEYPFIDILSAAREVADAFGPSAEHPFALLGHSMGAILAFELAREIRRRNLPSPRLLIVSASRAPDAPPTREPIHTLPDDEFLADVQLRFQAVPREVMENDELKRVMLPILRADITLYETYRYHEEPPLDMELLAIGGTEDSSVAAADLEHWRRHTRGRFTARRFPGDHFFLFSGGNKSPALSWIIEKINAIQ